MRRASTRSGRSAIDAPQAHVLDLEVILDAVLGSLAAVAGLFHAAEGSDLGGNDALVDPYNSVLEALGHAPDAADVTRVEVGREAEGRVVGERDGLGLR